MKGERAAAMTGALAVTATYVSFLLHAQRAAERYNVSQADILLELGRRTRPMMTISRPPFTAQASASERMVLLVGLVMMFPALRSQMNLSVSNTLPSRFKHVK